MSKIAGIDLGTTYSAISIIDEYGRPKVISNSEGNQTTPSVIFFNDEGEPIIGEVAKNSIGFDPEHSIQLVKRDMGKRMKNSSDKYIRYIDNNGKKYSPEELSSLILKKLKRDCEIKIGDTISEIVITVPAYFNNDQKKATIKAAKLAGFKVLRVINEPTAAALSYSMNKLDQEQTFMVYDLGGGTFDVSIARIKDKKVEILASLGDPFLGGSDFDEVLKNYCKIQFIKKYSKSNLSDFDEELEEQDLSGINTDIEDFLNRYAQEFNFNRAEDEELKMNMEILKKDLSTLKSKIKKLYPVSGLALDFEITREKFEKLTKPLLDKTSDKIDQIFVEAQENGINLSWSDIDNIILVGGASRMPMVKEMLSKKSNKTLKFDIQPDICVAEGAALAAFLETNPSPSPDWEDVISHSLGTAVVKDFNNPKSLYNSQIIPKFSKIPTEQKNFYKMKSPSSTSVAVMVYQGDDGKPVDECLLIGKLSLNNLPTRNNDKNSIEVTLKYDKNGVVKAYIKDLISGKTNSGEIQNQYGLPEDDDY